MVELLGSEATHGLFIILLACVVVRQLYLDFDPSNQCTRCSWPRLGNSFIVSSTARSA